MCVLCRYCKQGAARIDNWYKKGAWFSLYLFENHKYCYDRLTRCPTRLWRILFLLNYYQEPMLSEGIPNVPNLYLSHVPSAYIPIQGRRDCAGKKDGIH